MKARVDKLLAAYDRPESFLELAPLLGLAETTDQRPAGDTLDVGQTIGRYKLLQRLGAGGMGGI